MKKTEPEYYPPVENLLDLIYEHYTENNPVEKNTVAGKTAKAKEKELEEWLRGLEGMDVATWCEQHNITKANYYYRLKRVRQMCLEQMTDTVQPAFVELRKPRKKVE